MTTLAILLGTVAIIFYFYACVQRDQFNQLSDLMDLHLVQAANLVEHCEALEGRNAWLEGERCQYRALMAVAMMHSSARYQVIPGDNVP